MALIRITQRKPKWSYGATLWYMRLRPNASYRWYEVAYKHAALAAGPGMHVIELEFGPEPIDDENSESFFERWLTRLAQAYNGRLCPF